MVNVGQGAGGPKPGPSSQGIPIHTAATAQNLTVAQGGCLPGRPTPASNPNPIKLLANYFNLKLGTKPLTVYMQTFKVRGSKNQELRGATARDIFKSALTKLGAQPHRYATDFQQQIVSLDPLTVPPKTSDKKERRLDLEGSYIEFENDEQLRLDSSILSSPSPDVIDCLNLITGHGAREQEEIAAIGRHKFFPKSNDPFWKRMEQGQIRINLGSRFETGIPESLSVVRGFIQSVRPADAKLFLNVNSTFGVFRPVGNLGALYSDLANKHKFNTHSANEVDILTKLHGAISKARVVYDNPNEDKPPRTVNIAGFARKNDSVRENPREDKSDKKKGSGVASDFPRPHEVRFWFKGGQKEEYRTVLHHYQTKYGPLGPNERKFPLINIGTPSRPEHVLAPFCELKWGQQLRRKVTEIPGLDREKLDDLDKFTCRLPNDNLKWAKSAHQSNFLRLDQGANPVLRNFCVSVDKEPLKVNGRKLELPDIVYSPGGKPIKLNRPSWFVTKNPFYNKAKKKRWTWTYLTRDSKNIPPEVHTAVTELGTHLQQRCGQGKEPEDAIDHCFTLEGGYTTLNSILRSAKAKGISLVVLIFPHKVSAADYNAVKFFGDVQHGIHTSCIVMSNTTKKDRETKEWVTDWNYFANVSLKINLKLGGFNHIIGGQVDLLKRPELMVAGYDVTHPTGLDDERKTEDENNTESDASVKEPEDRSDQSRKEDDFSKDAKKEQSQVGLVVSADKDLGQWLPYYWNQQSRQEMANSVLTKAFMDRFEAWKSRNKGQKLPKLVIYRDGVSESQFGQILEQEIPRIREAYKEVFDGKTPQITLLVAVKRHTTRFIPDNSKDGGWNGNIRPGTVVDNGVTQKKYWEFFLASHEAIKGTTRPTRYVVILDEVFKNNYSQLNIADQVEKFTHQMSYMYGRATKGVGVCTPAYYADILCTRARAYMSALADEETLAVIKQSMATEEDDRVEKRVLSGEIHPDLMNSMYWI